MQLNGASAQHIDTMESLLSSTTRLTRLAAQRTGTTVSSAVWGALSVLVNDGPHRVGDLARAARISQPGMTKVVQNLVADEWVVRIADTGDSRATPVAVTDRGRAALLHWRRQLSDALSGSFTDLTESEWQILDRAAAILATHTTTASPTKEAVA
ncbi:hypothetical protein BH11ACT2_BH11ACT2_19960 [soil metagenome]